MYRLLPAVAAKYSVNGGLVNAKLGSEACAASSRLRADRVDLLGRQLRPTVPFASGIGAIGDTIRPITLCSIPTKVGRIAARPHVASMGDLRVRKGRRPVGGFADNPMGKLRVPVLASCADADGAVASLRGGEWPRQTALPVIRHRHPDEGGRGAVLRSTVTQSFASHRSNILTRNAAGKEVCYLQN